MKYIVAQGVHNGPPMMQVVTAVEPMVLYSHNLTLAMPFDSLEQASVVQEKVRVSDHTGRISVTVYSINSVEELTKIVSLLEDVLGQYDNNRDTTTRFILGFARESRKYGYYVVSGITDKLENEQILWAMRLLLNLSGARLLDDFSSDVFNAMLLQRSGHLKEDAIALVENARAMTKLHATVMV